MRKNILLLLLTAMLALPAFAEDIKLQDNPPDRYVVVKGDTLWHIAGRFLKQPWRWPEIWRMNREQIKNPDLIFPGDVIVLDRSEGTPRLRLLKNSKYTQDSLETVKLSPRVRVEDLKATAIPAISPADIEPFLGKPLILDKDGLQKAPVIVAAQEGRLMLGSNDTAYVQGLDRKQGTSWQIYRPGVAVVDPDTHKTLGYQSTYLGTARVVAFGDPTTIRIGEAREEINVGDRLIAPPEKDALTRFIPHAPSRAVRAKIISGYGSRSNELGRNDIVVLNKGDQEGLEVGDVLALYRHGAEIETAAAKGGEVKLPDERYGLVLVFRTFKQVAYGLVVQATRPVLPGDEVLNP